ncbi:GerAB/ArcD/ProY family transporter [Serpentinicella alkaliphila]|uniref:Spore germination protein KB n=1 Tax=Serpentinicella alkaliphila TaxID=1734049 RepID=A0A4R2TT50_9FIRM|nr:GerAB/ArcD/ProY family transporter [Serpentinicella alkaliphila]QUH25257.1 GerAB/ArcD/ProY family transporter [Serpentinicella alkaliphila]TCQ07068.1 spore germination protein KB [Serpentinicella alkaliphila]
MNNNNLTIISYRQILFLTIAQLGGAAILYLPGMKEAGRDVWISNIIASVMAYIVIYCNYLPLSLCPGGSMTKTLNKYWGKIFGGLVNVYYLLFFFILSLLIVSDVYYLGKITMPETPGYIFIIFFLIPTMYALKLGVEVFIRFMEFILPILVVIYIILYLLVIPKLDYQKILPIMSDGIKPVFSGAIPNLNFPYAQVLPVVFFYKHIKGDRNERKKFIKYSFLGILGATILLSIRSLASTTAFEEFTLKTLTFPPLSTIRIIQVGDVIERLDPFFYAILYIATFFKFLITFYVICEIISELFNVGEPRDFAIPVAVLIGVFMPYAIHKFDIILRTVVPYFILSIPLFFPIPILLYATIKYKNKKNKKETVNQ